MDATFSTYREDSEIRRIGRGELALGDADPDVREVLERCEELRRETDGYFDANASGSLDPSGLVKGWAVDRAAAILAAAGLRNFAVNAGGDIVLAGGALPDDRLARRDRAPGTARPRRRGRRDPRRRDRDLRRRTRAATTSSTRTPAGRRRDVLSVTIAGPDLGTADAYATAAFAMGLDGPAWTARLRGYEALTILADGRVLSTPGFPRAD